MNDQLVQGSDEWLKARCGKVTASRMADLTARTKTGYGAGRANYMAELIAETLTGEPAKFFTNAAMQHGTDTEPQARTAYEFYRDEDVIERGLVDHPTIPMSAASPDGLVGDFGLVEIKCPNTATHIDTLLSGKVPVKYIKQMQWQMACIERKWCDFVSFDDRLPESLSFFCKRIERDNDLIADMTTEVVKFQDEMSDKLSRLNELGGAS